METLFQILNPEFLLRNALYASILVGLVAPWVGVYFVLRRSMIFLAVALPQVSAMGIALAFLLPNLGFHLYGHRVDHSASEERILGLIGSLTLTLGAIFLLAILERRGKGITEGRIGLTYALASALTILFVAFNPMGEIEIVNLLKGEIVSISSTDFWTILVVYGLVAGAILYFQKEFLLVSYDRDMAIALHKNVILWDILLYLIVGVTISLGVMTTGPLVIFGFLVLPPLAARLIAETMKAFCLISSVLGSITAFLGFYISYRYDLPLGPTDITLACFIFFLVLFIKKLFLKQVRVEDAEVEAGASFVR